MINSRLPRLPFRSTILATSLAFLSSSYALNTPAAENTKAQLTQSKNDAQEKATTAKKNAPRGGLSYGGAAASSPKNKKDKRTK